jgi:hypothetical protein
MQHVVALLSSKERFLWRFLQSFFERATRIAAMIDAAPRN